MPITRVERRNSETMLCLHCKKVKPVFEMSLLSCNSPSDCCNQCWNEFVNRHPTLFERHDVETESFEL